MKMDEKMKIYSTVQPQLHWNTWYTCLDNSVVRILHWREKSMQSGKRTLNIHIVICYKLVLKSVSYPKIMKNTPILIQQSIDCNVYT